VTEKQNKMEGTPTVKKLAIICDIDGTLATVGKRSPYFAGKADIVDSANMPVVETVKLFKQAGYEIIFVTGREEKFMDVTLRQIAKYTGWINGSDYILHMRKNSDRRKDCEYKEEIYNTHIAPFYNVLFALEDRDQMVKAYRDVMNVPCMQVAWGNF
jgi:hypothetical protein